MKEQSEWPILAVVRLLLASVVLVCHSSDFIYVGPVLSKLCGIGAECAVLCFLVVSGYSIAHSLRNGSRGFYLRRFNRIYPLYFVSLVIAGSIFLFHGREIHLDYWHYSAPRNILLYLGNFLFLDTFTQSPISSNGAIWSLSVEVSFYAIAPLILRWRTRYILMAIAISCFAFAFHGYISHVKDIFAMIYGLPSLLLGWAWLSGFLLHRHLREPRMIALIMVIGLVMVSIWNQDSSKHDQIVYGSCILLIAFARFCYPIPKAISNMLLYLGDISYPLYILHFPVLLGLVIGFKPNVPLILIAPWLAAIAGYHLIDKPYRSWVKCHYPRKTLPHENAVLT